MNRYALSSLPRKTRLTIIFLLLALTLGIVYTDYLPNIVASFTGGFLAGMLIGELISLIRQSSKVQQQAN